MLDREDEYRKMAECERDHWWYRNLHDRCLRTIADFFAAKSPRILDAACGTGGLLLKLKGAGHDQLHGFDLSPTAVARARAGNLDVVQADLRDLSRVFPTVVFDVIVSNDSLYFLGEKEQEAFVRTCHDRLHTGGVLIMNLPARAAFSGMHDRAVGISRRFEPDDVARLAETASWDIVGHQSWPMLLSPLIFAARNAQRMRLGSSSDVVVSDVRMPPDWVNALLYRLTSLERFCPGTGYGSSIFLVLKKREPRC